MCTVFAVLIFELELMYKLIWHEYMPFNHVLDMNIPAKKEDFIADEILSPCVTNIHGIDGTRIMKTTIKHKEIF